MEPDHRSSLWLKNVDGCRLSNYGTKVAKDVEPYVLMEVEGFKVRSLE